MFGLLINFWETKLDLFKFYVAVNLNLALKTIFKNLNKQNDRML